MRCFRNFHLILTLLIPFGLYGCTSATVKQESTQHTLITDKQVKEFVSQWHMQQDSIAKLTAMEADLQLLIMALSSQSELSENPPLLTQNKPDITYSNEAVKPLEPTTVNSLSEAKLSTPQNLDLALIGESKVGAQLGWYLNPDFAIAKVTKLKAFYPNAFSQFSFAVFENKKSNITLYGLRVGPFKSNAEVSMFCYLVNQLDQACDIAAFIGKPI